MHDTTFIPFTEEMKKTYKILVPNMLPRHLKFIISQLRTYGYDMELLETTGPEIAETGLQYTHNDTCYPAILVIGQFIHALKSGNYDPRKTALVMFQTGGGCRASNYVSLIRKALIKAELGFVPVISFSVLGLEKHPGFKIGLKELHGMLYGVLYGDLLMSLVNQVRPYEINRGDAEKLADKYTRMLSKEIGSGGKINYKKIKERYRTIIADFAKIPMERRKAVKVGVVGEIFVKYSPLGNNNLEQFLVDEGAEVVVPGLIDFCLYYAYNLLSEYKIYKKGAAKYPLYKFIYRFLCKKKEDISDAIREEGTFEPWTHFDRIAELGESIISTAVKMGEGWLLTAEMLELAETGAKNIVCTQPFGCLPNHIVGKGMMKPIKELNPEINIVAVDYDAGASRVNQENRLKLMLANARRNLEAQENGESAPVTASI